MAAANTVSQGISAAPTSIQIAALQDRTDHTLLEIVRDNLSTQYATQAAPLAAFRDAISTHGSPGSDDTLLAAFRSHVPLSTYDTYKPFIDKFDARPCKVADVTDLLAPGLPEYFATSSATSGVMPKLLPKYGHSTKVKLQLLLNPNHLLAALFCTHNREIREIVGTEGEVVRRVPVCIVTGAMLRKPLGWLVDDETNMSLSVPGYAVPWAATVIGHLPSFLTIHGLFFLSRRDVEQFAAPFVTLFLDLMRYIGQQWDLLVSCVREGTVPDLEGVDHVRGYLKAHLHADPERAAELVEIGPPFLCEGWVARVWPKVHTLTTVCSGPFATVLPQVKTIVGPNIAVRTAGYRASEATIGLAHNSNVVGEFVLKSPDVIEFLDVSRDATHEQVSQPWEVEVGRQYEPILTTRDGLWRYRLDDVLAIIGFDAESGSPVFKYGGRRSMGIRLPHTLITDDQLLTATQALALRSEEDGALRVQEFTTLIDDRTVPPTVGYLVELPGPPGPQAHRAPQRLFEALVSTNLEHARALANGQMRLPTIRVVESGTFAAYRSWRGGRVGVAAGQIKVPVVVVQPEVQAWILERVAREL